tara:strand:- start:734 stop:913 length:180 start_codon:yes stop_codon:yes gene_type:complete
MPSSLKMNFYSNTYSITNLNNEITSNQNQQQIILGAKKNRKCSLLFLQGNKHCKSCGGR